MPANTDKPNSPGSPVPEEAAKPAPEGAAPAPLDRIWTDPIGVGEATPFDPDLFEPIMSPEEVEKMLGGEKAPEAPAPPPLDRIWADPIGVGEATPFDPDLFEPTMSPVEYEALPDEEDRQDLVERPQEPEPHEPPQSPKAAEKLPAEPNKPVVAEPVAKTAAVPAPPAPTVPAAPPPPRGPSPLELLRDAVGREDKAAVRQHLLTLGVDEAVCEHLQTAWELVVAPGVPKPQRLAGMHALIATIRQIDGEADVQDELWRLQKGLTKYS